jgi:uncharacterized protein with GYD domain
MIAYAAEPHIDAAKSVLAKIESVILFPLMSFMLSVAFLYFLWGAYQFVANAESDGGRETGKMHMLYGVIGMVVMVSALAILRIAAGTFGVSVPN